MSEIIRRTTVISVRGRKPADLLSDPNFIYVGRSMLRQGWKGSIWGNPFKSGMSSESALAVMDGIPISDDRAPGEQLWDDEELWEPIDAVLCCEYYVMTRRSLWARLPELQNKILGCWCGNWKSGDPDLGCHAVVLARLADNWRPDVRPTKREPREIQPDKIPGFVPGVSCDRLRGQRTFDWERHNS